jgi:dihydrofolate reductase
MSAIALIAAIDRHYAIGRDGAMPWHLPDDLKRFKALTLGKPVLMGRKTAVAIGRPLPGRPNFVLTRSGAAPFDGQRAVASLDAAIDAANGADLMVIGGGEVYALALPIATPTHTFRISIRRNGARHSGKNTTPMQSMRIVLSLWIIREHRLRQRQADIPCRWRCGYSDQCKLSAFSEWFACACVALMQTCKHASVQKQVKHIPASSV